MRTLVRWDPAMELDTLQSEMNRLFNGFFGAGAEAPAGRRWIPPMDVAEREDHLELKLDLPGMSEDDVAIEIKDGVLSISGERASETKDERGGYQRVERSRGSFSRSVTLPEGIDQSKVAAGFDRGVLEIRIPKPEERRPHRVEISNGGTPAIEGEAREKPEQ